MQRASFLCGLAALVAGAGALAVQADPGIPPSRGRVQRAAPPPDPSDAWQVIYLGKSRIGYAHTLTRRATIDRRTVVKSDSEMRLSIKRFGESLKVETRQQVEERSDGELVSFIFEMKNPPSTSTRTIGRVRTDRLIGETTVGGATREFSIRWEPGAKSPAFVDRFSREHRLKAGDKHSFRVFLPEQIQFADVRVWAGRRSSLTLFDGRRQELLEVTTTESILPQSPVHDYVDERGQALVSTSNMLGQTLTSYAVPAAEALKQIAGSETDLALDTLVKCTVIPNAHRTKRAVFRVKMPGEDPTAYFPIGSSQKVVRVGADECEITVRAVAPATSHRSIRVDRQYLAASQYLQTADPDVRSHAERAAPHLADPAQIAVAMEKYVYQRLQKKDFSIALASAGEVAKSLQGDCTEHAVLLAAMLRVKNVPSRVVVGLVYIEPLAAFGGHMWTEALLGDLWVPLDATLGLGGTGACHIKLADSSLSDQGPAPTSVFLPMLRVLGQIELTVVNASTN